MTTITAVRRSNQKMCGLRVGLILLLVSLLARGDDHTVNAVQDLTINKSQLVADGYGVLTVHNGTTEQQEQSADDFCIIHYNQHYLPETRASARSYQLINFTIDYPSYTICNSENGTLPPLSTNSIILIKYDQIPACNLSRQAAMLQQHPLIRGVLLSFPRNHRVHDVQVDVNATQDPHFIISLISERSATFILSHFVAKTKAPVMISVFSPANHERSTSTPFDLSLLVIWLVAVFTVTVGSYWSGSIRSRLFFKRKYKLTGERAGAAEGGESRRKSTVEEEPYLNISPLYIVFFVICMAGMLVALYFFFQYLVYLIIGLFVLASILSTYACGEPVVAWLLPSAATSFAVPICSKRHRTPIYQVFVLLCAVALAVTWFVTRHEPYSWVLQDILGVFFSINMLRTIRLPSFKICFVLLLLLFFYDIFFVFLTPLFTSSGDSVMVEVATGGSKSDDSGSPVIDGNTEPSKPPEQLPMVLRVPHLSITAVNASDPLEVCYRDVRMFSYSLLGFGDILVPGLLVSYCHAFDLIHQIRGRPYFITTNIFYGLGLIVTFAGLYLMNGIAQPALLYLVPMTVIPPVVIASCRGELRKLWDGPGDGTESRNSAGGTPDKSVDGQDGNGDSNSLLENDGAGSGETSPSSQLQTQST